LQETSPDEQHVFNPLLSFDYRSGKPLAYVVMDEASMEEGMNRKNLWMASALIALLVSACTSTPDETEVEVPQVEEPADVATDVPPTDPPPTEPEPTAIPPTEEPVPVISGETDVTVIDSSYRLKVINISVGTTVTWIYDGGLPHTVTAEDGAFESGTMGEGDTFTFTFEEAGTFPYYCQFHGSPGGIGMSGVVNVTEG
jgi:plastocyanin